MSLSSWVPVAHGSPFPVENLPYGVFSHGEEDPRVCVAIGRYVLDLAPLAASEGADFASVFQEPTLNPFMALGRRAWRAVRHWLTERLTDESHRPLVEPELVPRDQVRLHMPFTVADFVDFYASEHHATRLGQILRPGEPPLNPNWKHLPVGYHGRAGTVVVSGTPVRRPSGQFRPADAAAPEFGPTSRLDIEAEVGFVIGTPTEPGSQVSVDDVRDHVFGVVLVNDWSARDLQAWEARPLGPFLGKSFLTSISPWVVPLDALEPAMFTPPTQVPEPLAYLRGTHDFGLDLELTVSLNGTVLSRPRYADMYWTPGQKLAHLTANGAALRTGDLFASGTVSGPREDTCGSLIELTDGGTRPVTLADGSQRTFLLDGDTVTIEATAPAGETQRLGFGEVTGTVCPATAPAYRVSPPGGAQT
ncbi:fumarylacetoacetase [Actinopolymorpha sp. B11F2]|uniref:fumarylacetoacetase n=1 Tax=Actinopolymorpha sp. B11F2 TaxID=3160862 RepID=UPI0032E4B086